MERYYNTNTVSDANNIKHYVSTIYPNINISDDDIYIISREADRLDILAKQYYNDATLWWIIALANDHSKPSLFLDEGTQIRIPRNIISYLNNYNKTNMD